MPSVRPSRTSHRKPARNAKTWGGGHPHKAGIALSLSRESIQAEAGVAVDSILVSSILGPQQPKTEGRRHNVNSLALDPNLLVDDDSRRRIYEQFEASKGQITFSCEADTYLKSARNLASELYEKEPVFKSLGVDARAALDW